MERDDDSAIAKRGAVQSALHEAIADPGLARRRSHVKLAGNFDALPLAGRFEGYRHPYSRDPHCVEQTMPNATSEHARPVGGNGVKVHEESLDP